MNDGIFGDPPTMAIEVAPWVPLTTEELAELPTGTRLLVTWCGGNGPHEYELQWHAGLPCAHLVADTAHQVGVLNYIGAEQPWTQAWELYRD